MTSDVLLSARAASDQADGHSPGHSGSCYIAWLQSSAGTTPTDGPPSASRQAVGDSGPSGGAPVTSLP